MVFTTTQLQGECQEQILSLYIIFVDLTKTFDTVSHYWLWNIMHRFGCPHRFITLVRQFHDGMLARVQDHGEFQQPFPVTSGVEQGCVITPNLFSTATDTFHDVDIRIVLRHQVDVKPSTLETASKIQSADWCHPWFIFTGECSINDGTQSEIQECISLFSAAWEDFGLTISTKRSLPTWSWCTLHRAHHYSGWWKTCHGIQVHLPWQQLIQDSHHQ